MIETILAQFGKIDVAFCNAGICINAPADEMTYAQFKKVIDVNLNGVFLTSQQLPRVDSSGKAAIDHQYRVDVRPYRQCAQPQCAYNASKAGVIMLTKSMAVEFAKTGVRVNSISPGYIGTDLVLESPNLKPLIEQWNALSPIGRMGRPDELQAIAVYLAGDASDFTTGSDFVVDGAFTCF